MGGQQEKGIMPILCFSFEQHEAAASMISLRMRSPDGLGQGVTVRG